MKPSQKAFISPLLLALVAVLLIGGGAYVYVQQKQVNQPVTATSTAQTSNSKTVGWNTYTNSQYGFEVKYPNTWEVQEYKEEQGLSSDTIGFVPQNLTDFFQCAENARHLQENYKTYNPFPGYEQYSDRLAKAECGVHFRIEANASRLSLKDFLTQNFSINEWLQPALGGLQTTQMGIAGTMLSPYYAFIFGAGFDGGVKAVVAGGPQYLVPVEDSILFIAGFSIEDQNYNDIFTTIVQSIQAIP